MRSRLQPGERLVVTDKGFGFKRSTLLPHGTQPYSSADHSPPPQTRPASRPLGAYGQTLKPMSLGKASEAMSKQVRHNGEFMTRKAMIDAHVKGGASVRDSKTGRRLTLPDGRFLDEAATTKTGMDYAASASARFAKAQQLRADRAAKRASAQPVAPPTPSLRAQADAFREKNRRFGNPETEAQYRKQLADRMRKTRPRGAQGISEEGKRNYQTAENSDLELTVRQTQSMPKSFGTRSLARKYGEFAKSILAQRAEAVAAKLAATRAIPRGTPGRIRIASDAKEARRLGVTKAADALTIGRTTEGIRSGALPKDTLTDYLKSQQKVLKNQESAIFRARDDSDRKYAENAAAKARRKVELANITKTLLSRKPMKPARTAARS